MADLDVVLVDVCKTFAGDTKAVIDFSAEIERGEFVAIPVSYTHLTQPTICSV